MELTYLQGYPDHLLDQVRQLIEKEQLGERLLQRYPDKHQIQSDRALHDYTQELKKRHLKSAPPLSKVLYAGKEEVVRNALGLHSFVSRVQGAKLKSKNEIRIASLFKEAPPQFLEMIVVHELAHLREREHNKAFYQLCQYMAPDYHQWEFDLRIWLTWRSLSCKA